MLVDVDLTGWRQAALGHLGDVHEAVLVDAQVNKGAKLGHVGDDAVQFHALAQVLDVVDAIVKFPYLHGRTRVAAGFLQFGHDVAQGGLAHILCEVTPRVDFVSLGLVLDQIGDAAPAVFGHTLDKGIALGVNSAVVQRIVTLGDAQKAGCLLKRFGPQFGHVEQFLARCEVAVGGTVIDDVLGKDGSQAGDIGEEFLGGGVDVHAHTVDATLHGEVQGLFEAGLVHIVLILSHADGLGVNLHQFGQRVEQAAPDGDCSAHGHILVGELVTGDLAGAIDGGAVLAHDKHVDGSAVADALEEPLGLAACGAVAQGDGIDLVGLGEGVYLFGRALHVVMRWSGIDDVMIEQVALFVQTHDLTARAESRINGQHALVAQWGSKQQLAHVLCKRLDGLVVGLLLGCCGKLGLDRGLHQALEAIFGGLLDQL